MAKESHESPKEEGANACPVTYLAVGCTLGYTNASPVEVDALHDDTSETDETNLDPVSMDAAPATGVNDAANFLVKEDLILFTPGTFTPEAIKV